MLYITNENVASLLNTGNELTAQCISADLQTLCLGVSDTPYMYKDEAKELLSDDEFDSACNHAGNKNPLFVHLDEATLFHLLRREEFVVTNEDEG